MNIAPLGFAETKEPVIGPIGNPPGRHDIENNTGNELNYSGDGKSQRSDFSHAESLLFFRRRARLPENNAFTLLTSHCFLAAWSRLGLGRPKRSDYWFFNFCNACSAAMVIGSALGSEEISGLQAEVKVVRSEIVFPPRIKAETASISLDGAIE